MFHTRASESVKPLVTVVMNMMSMRMKNMSNRYWEVKWVKKEEDSDRKCAEIFLF